MEKEKTKVKVKVRKTFFASITVIMPHMVIARKEEIALFRITRGVS